MEALTIDNPIDWEKHPNVFAGYNYAIDVVNGKIPNCIWAIGACKRFLRDIDRCKDPSLYFYFDVERAETYLRKVQLLHHVIGEWDTPNIEYLSWQKFLWMNIIGFRHRKNPRNPRYRVAHVEVPRGCAKSTMASQAALYFVGLDTPLMGNQVSCFATKSDQARIVLDASRAMAMKSEKYRKASGVIVEAHKIVHKESFSFVRAMSSDDKGMDGLNDILSICDELHAMSRDLFEVVSSGMSKRRDSLMLCITTAGFDMEGIGYSQSNYAKKVALGEFEDDQFFAILYTVDVGDDLFEELTWKKANPNYGYSVDPITFAAKALKAREVPADLPNFKVKHLNVWLSESKSYYDVNKWDDCADPNLKFEDFHQKYCYSAIDLASKVDLTSFGFLFREKGHYYFFDKSYIPEKTVEEARNALYDNCIGSNYLFTTPGEAINYAKLEEDFGKIHKSIRNHATHYDPWNATQFAQNLEKSGINVVEFRMNYANFSEAMKTLDALIREKKIHHNGSPLLRFCIGNIVAKRDPAENVYPVKSHPNLKIDPIITLLMCLAGWISEKEEEKAYEDHGIRYI